MKGWRTIFCAKRPQKKAGVVILISDKLNFKLKTVVRDKEGHYIILKGSIHQENLTTVNIYAPNMGAANYIRKLLIRTEGHIDMTTFTAGDLNTPLSVIDHPSRKSIKKQEH